ncbi:uncharacterized protein EHS24_007628 [Apiotrichum porosum]|uniref:Uncharacterized protein n=1 Tax=Apiotrichum porosum TaxID=105984 RepID=A0A427XUK5_9TREE|nr:uncharacterized protein EHS24_007628 [Apiotrichum porosum]RSH82636.1 hypothetical protein EHS24_007628 [Apiotrichum porosum]
MSTPSAGNRLGTQVGGAPSATPSTPLPSTIQDEDTGDEFIDVADEDLHNLLLALQEVSSKKTEETEALLQRVRDIDLSIPLPVGFSVTKTMAQITAIRKDIAELEKKAANELECYKDNIHTTTNDNGGLPFLQKALKMYEARRDSLLEGGPHDAEYYEAVTSSLKSIKQVETLISAKSYSIAMTVLIHKMVSDGVAERRKLYETIKTEAEAAD